jgi:hypothetical protein
MLSLYTPQKFKLRQFRMVENMQLKNMVSRSPSMSSPPFKISFKFTSRFKRVSLHPPQKFKRPQFWSCGRYRTKMWRLDHLQWRHPLPNFIKIHQTVQKLFGGHTDIQKERQAGDITGPLSFLMNVG